MPQTKHVNTTHKHYPSLPKASTTYGKIIKSLLPIGKQPKVKKDQLPTVIYGVESLKIDRKNLGEYRKICGFIDEFHVPVTYFAVLSQSLQMNMMVNEPFPFAMLGLVHVANSVTQYRPISQNEIFSLSVQLDNLREHDKGQQFDFVTTVKVKDELVWEGVSTYLARSKQTAKKSSEKKAPTPKLANDNSLIDTTFSAPEDIGRRYAKISGDFNLIHIHPISARALGFRKAIAHGMWSKAKSLAKIKNLPDAYSVDVAFKLPIFLPSKVELIVNKVENADDKSAFLEMGLYSAKDDKPHLTGVIKKLS
ncbi:MAG: acyl dehydratase [Moraxellaceae bacterium]|nr:acyl dehydratase [Moraxellaceae bacterium]